jgi:hypothetical protein
MELPIRTTACWLICMIAALAPSSTAQQSARQYPDSRHARAGLIEGTVVHPDGKPVNGAIAYADPLGRPVGIVLPHDKTDKAGHFTIRIPVAWFGRFAVTAKKEDEDYPEMNQFYSKGKFQTVILTLRDPTARVTIRLGPKAGVLLGAVTDALTGAALNPCVELRRASSPGNFLSGSGLIHRHYRLLIPSDAGVFVKLWLDGYEAWYYPGTAIKSAARPILLRPGEQRTLNISLRPDRQETNTGCPAPLRIQ